MTHLAPLYLLLAQGLLGAFDTLFYHEYHQQLPRNESAKGELRIHAARDFAYAFVFTGLGLAAWHGRWAWLMAAVLLFEIVITLYDFVEEDMTRILPPGERVMHTIMAIVYGAFLAHLQPELRDWWQQPTEVVRQWYGWLSPLLAAMGCGVGLSGARDVIASYAPAPAEQPVGHYRPLSR